MKKRRKGRGGSGGCIIVILFLVFLFLILFHRFEKVFFPIVLEMSENQSKQQANRMMDTAIQNAIEKFDVTSEDFFIVNGTTDTIATNTLLVNSFCSYISDEMTDALEKMGKDEIKVPVGVVSGFDFLSAKGPAISFWLVPQGIVKVDYETNFESAGINQLYFKIWLDISMEMKIVNPLIEEKAILKRKMMLVDTIIRGEVPDNYLDLERKQSEFSY